jgi:hypothetical protein
MGGYFLRRSAGTPGFNGTGSGGAGTTGSGTDALKYRSAHVRLPEINMAPVHDLNLNTTLAADRTRAKSIGRGAENLERRILGHGP